MSYYSKVMISIKKKDYDRLIKEIKKLDDLSWREEHYLIETIWKSATFLYPTESEFYKVNFMMTMHFFILKKLNGILKKLKALIFLKIIFSILMNFNSYELEKIMMILKKFKKALIPICTY